MDHSWSQNYTTSDNLKVRLDSIANSLISDGLFGMEYLTDEDVDNKRVVNIGCGLGNHDETFFRQHHAVPAKYVLVDKSAEIAHEAISRLAHVPHLEAVVSDIDDIQPSTLGKFDTAICMHVLYHVPAPDATICRIAQLLDPAGKALFTTVAHDSNIELIELHRKALATFHLIMENPTSWRFDSANAMVMILACFKNAQVFNKKATLAFKDTESALAYYQSLPWFHEAIENDIDAAKFLSIIRGDIRTVIEARGEFSCNKDTVTIIAVSPSS